MSKKYKPYEHPRWRETPSFKVVGDVPITEEQQKQEEQFQEDFTELMKKRKENKK
ncbi:hypothetical protein [Metasolibacillus sp.]|uniref:hypothetical protein n=1 Tax=Metasolibacillus sp. TaxID=2703680 RepID=UPI0025F278C0|nr:hypothetical protein [Metasolibacillus sp.]MCT6925305.1 hypothetical protein [Metasolibacillus sp.]MCT6941465.1 hypothetical protein [Metasolibacillus sp.]